MKRFILYALIVLTSFACSKKEVGPQCINCTDEETETKISDVLIVNEGNFGFGNASISLYKPNQQVISNNIYQQANFSLLGDVAQSITQIGNMAYIVINNSNKIEVVDITTFNSIATISGFNSPRYILPVDNTKAYVTDLYSNSIQIVDLTSKSITGNIAVSDWTENLLLHNDTVYVCDMENDNIILINPTNDVIIDSVKVGVSPNSILKDANNKLWIMCSGGFTEENPKLIKFNPQTRSIENTFVFPDINDSPGNLNINLNTGELYFINTDVYKMNITSVTLPSTPIITSNNNTYYGLGVDTVLNEVYVADAIDYVQNGIVFRYSSSGSLIDQFNAGVIPGNFHFIE